MNNKLNEYEIESEAFNGKGLIIYKGKRISDGYPVSIKLWNKENPTYEDMKALQREFERGSKIRSKYIIRYLELINCDNGLAIVREYCSGENLSFFLKDGELPLKEVLMIFVDVCIGLEEIHSKKIVHGAINAFNIRYDREKKKVKIVGLRNSDYYPSKNFIFHEDKISDIDISYISPEQTGRMNRTIDYRSDLYSLGVTFYEMLTGKLPFISENTSELIYCQIAKEPEPITKINSSVPLVISDIVMKLIAKTPENRYKSALGVRKDLERCLQQLGNSICESFELGEYDFSGELYIPQKIYGREQEITILKKSFEKVAKGTLELLLISGVSGVGKSTLVKEITDSVHEKSGYLIIGKFEQFQNNFPYSAVIQALDNFIKQILVESSSKLDEWKHNILKAVGNNGQVVIDVLPSLELVIGKQPSVPKLGGVESQNRFNMVFLDFVQIVATKEHPLVMFLDDWQWADYASMNFIRTIMTDQQNKYLLVIGAYRGNEVHSHTPITSFIDEMIDNKIITNIIRLEELQKDALKLLLVDTLVSLEQDFIGIEALADCIWDKTHGNPFFVKQFLSCLYDLGYLWFDYSLMKWCFNISEVSKLNITENVIDLLNRMIKTLDVSTINLLKYGACIGNQFDLERLSLIRNIPYEYMESSLKKAIKIGLIYELRKEKLDSEEEVKYKFSHDRIQQAVYTMISDEEKSIIHLLLGKSMIKNPDNLNSPERLFETVRHLNAGSSTVFDEALKVKLAELNLKAGKLAKKTSAYYSAFKYFTEGIKLLNNNSWEDYYDLTLQLYSEISEAACLIKKYNDMNNFIDIVLNNGKTVVDKIRVLKVQIEAYQARLNLREAMKTSVSVLQSLGIHIPNQPKPIDFEETFQEVWKYISNIQIEDLTNKHPMKDPIKLAAMKIMLSSTPIAYQLDTTLANIIICKMTELTVKYGGTPYDPAVFSYFAATLCSCINNIDSGDKLNEYINLAYKLGKLSCDLVEDPNMKEYKALVLDINNVFVRHWKEHIKETLKPCIEGYWSGVETGSFDYAAYCISMYSKNSLYSGELLKTVEKEINMNIKRLNKIQQGLSIIWIKIFGQMVQNLQGECKDTLVLKGGYFDEDKMMPYVEKIGDISGKQAFYLVKMKLNYLFRNYSEALEYGQKIEKNIDSFGGTIDITYFLFFDSLTRLAIHLSLTNEQQEENLAKVNKNLSKMNTWAKLAPMNFLHRLYLVEAELRRVTGDVNEARKLYDKSIDLAKENKYLNDEALAYELTARYCLGELKMEDAKIYLNEARNKYQHWGAMAKVKDLEAEYTNIFFEKKGVADINQNIDLFSIMSACQAISSEINLNGLLSRLLTVMIENMGAQRGVLILKRGDKFFIEAYVDEASNKKEILASISLSAYGKLPKAVIRYTARTGQSIVYPNDEYMDFFNKDSYIANHQPKSFFSTPIKLKNEIKGVLYLENNLIEGAFNLNRIKVIEILTTQVAISLENAMLYNTLEQNMKDQLRKIEDKLDVTASSAGLGLWDWKVQTGETIFNEQWASMLGYTLSELYPSNYQVWVNLTHPDDRNKTGELLTKYFSKELDIYECELRMNHKDGYWVWILTRGRVIEWDESNKPIRMVGIHMNITERKKIENELKTVKRAAEDVIILKDKFLNNISQHVINLDSTFEGKSNLTVVIDRTKELERTNLILEEVNAILQREIEQYSKAEAELIKAKVEADNANIAKSNFIATISHELRTPIAVILSGLQLIEANIQNDTMADQKKILKHISTIKQNCYRLLRLVNNIIDVTKVDAGFSTLKLNNVNIINLIESIATSVVEYARLKGITIIFDTDEEERIIALDPDKIERILLNLLSNAIKFTPKDGYIYVNIQNQNTKVIISIEDTGIGIPVEKKHEIFEKFQQLDNTFTRRNEGSGIGLSIVKAFVELHGGNISVFSELGKGSKFIIELPATKLDEDALEITSNSKSIGNVDVLNIEFSDIYF